MPAVRVSNVSKLYRTYSKPTDRLIEAFVPKAERHREFQALKSVSFELPRGETLGIVGRNGSGKSTLLQIICGTMQPSSGEVSVQGRVAALLELGAGFNSEFTGRENVHLNATILGMRRDEIAERFDAIAAFADLGDFIDQPVKTYSSGMFVRLAFATAINTDPDILVVDEALAVGDEAFQRKCFAKIEEIQARGGTILFVSHSAGSITQLCSRAMLIDQGEVILDGRPKTVAASPLKFMKR
ncbi:MAG: ABC transporter ATP-binding protein [Pseudomonadota bacterium]